MPKIQWDPKITLGNVLTVLVMLSTLVGGYIALKVEVQAASTAVVQVTADVANVRRQVEPIDGLETRMAVVERNQVTGKDAREMFQSQIAASVEQLRQQNIAILTQLSALVARLDERDRITSP